MKGAEQLVGASYHVDGEVVSGESLVDQSTITGESFPVKKGQGSNVFAGTIGMGLRLEGFSIEPPEGIEIEYMAHIQRYGDTDWVGGDNYVGTRDENLRIEGFAIRLKGDSANKYTIKYQGHVQSIGNTPIFSDGEYCGTSGQSLRLEAMRVWIEKKGSQSVNVRSIIQSLMNDKEIKILE